MEGCDNAAKRQYGPVAEQDARIWLFIFSIWL